MSGNKSSSFPILSSTRSSRLARPPCLDPPSLEWCRELSFVTPTHSVGPGRSTGEGWMSFQKIRILQSAFARCVVRKQKTKHPRPQKSFVILTPPPPIGTASRWCPLSHGKAIDVKWKTCYIRLADGSTARSLLVGSFARVKRETRHMTPVCEPTGCDEGSRNGERKECNHILVDRVPPSGNYDGGNEPSVRAFRAVSVGMVGM